MEVLLESAWGWAKRVVMLVRPSCLPFRVLRSAWGEGVRWEAYLWLEGPYTEIYSHSSGEWHAHPVTDIAGAANLHRLSVFIYTTAAL